MGKWNDKAAKAPAAFGSSHSLLAGWPIVAPVPRSSFFFLAALARLTSEHKKSRWVPCLFSVGRPRGSPKQRTTNTEHRTTNTNKKTSRSRKTQLFRRDRNGSEPCVQQRYGQRFNDSVTVVKDLPCEMLSTQRIIITKKNTTHDNRHQKYGLTVIISSYLSFI